MFLKTQYSFLLQLRGPLYISALYDTSFWTYLPVPLLTKPSGFRG